MSADQYRRLPGRSGPIIRNSLWIGDGHLLSVQRNPFSESYRRFYFTDIQAVVLTELPNAAQFYGYVVASLLVLTAGALFYTRYPVWACLCDIVALAAFFVGWRTKNCACYVHTSTSIERLPSLGRRKQATIAVARLTAEIEQTQGGTSPEMLLSPPPERPAAVSKLALSLRHCSGHVHWVVFSMMLVRSAVLLVSMWRRSSLPIAVAAGVTGTSLLILLIAAAIQQRRSDLALSIRRTIFAALAFYVASGLASGAVSIYLVFQMRPTAAKPVTAVDISTMNAYAIVDMAGFVVIGCIGLVLMWRRSRAMSTPPPLAPGSAG